MQFYKDAVSGIKWTSFVQIIKQILQYFVTLILVGLLSPSDFGLMAMSLVFVGFLEIFKDLGTASALIQKQKINDSFLSSIYWINLIFGIIAFLLLFGGSYLIADFYKEPRLISILQVLSINFVFVGFSSVQKALLEKKIKFSTISKIELSSYSIGMIVGITFAYNGSGVWSLIFQSITTTLILSFGYFFSEKWKPSFVYNHSEIKKILNFSGNLLGYNVFNYFVRNADYLLIGKFLGDKALGHYYLAYRIMLYPIQNITVVVSRVMFPVYAVIQNDNEKFKKIYIKVTNAIALISFPMMLGIMIISFPFSRIFFGESWNAELIAILLMILSPVGLIQSICSTTGPIYQAKNKTNWLFLWGLATGFIAVTAFIIGLNWGVIGVALAYLFVTILWNYHCFAIPFKLIDLKFLIFVKSFKEIIVANFIMVIFTSLTSLLLSNWLSDVWNLVLTILVAMVIYTIAIYLFSWEKLKEIVEAFNIK